MTPVEAEEEYGPGMCCHAQLLVTCTACNGRDRREAAATPVRAFEARYPGHCQCGWPIAVGDLIVVADGRATHADCGDAS